jgi:hypothetical protein
MAAVAADISAAVDLLVALINNAQQISTMIQAAQGAGQTTLTPDQWATIIGADNSAEASLTQAIATAKAAGK